MAVAQQFPLPGLEISGGKLTARADKGKVGVCSMVVAVGRKEGVRPFSSYFIHRSTIVNLNLQSFSQSLLLPLSSVHLYSMERESIDLPLTFSSHLPCWVFSSCLSQSEVMSHLCSVFILLSSSKEKETICKGNSINAAVNPWHQLLFASIGNNRWVKKLLEVKDCFGCLLAAVKVLEMQDMH